MSILQILSEDHNKWLNYATKLTNDKTLAKDIVQEMYIKIHNAKPKEIKCSYIYTTLRNLFYDECKRLSNIEFKVDEFISEEPKDDEIKEIVKEKLKKQDPLYSELALIQADGTSYRKISYLYKIGRNKCYNNISKVKEELSKDEDIIKILNKWQREADRRNQKA